MASSHVAASPAEGWRGVVSLFLLMPARRYPEILTSWRFLSGQRWGWRVCGSLIDAALGPRVYSGLGLSAGSRNGEGGPGGSSGLGAHGLPLPTPSVLAVARPGGAKRGRLGAFVSHFTVSASDRGITRVDLGSSKGRRRPLPKKARRWMTLALRELKEYLGGRRSFFDVPCDLEGLSPFQKKVLQATSRIPYGEVRTYRWVAEQVGRPKAVRAVGGALHQNPIPFIIPCHRVIRKDGSLGGYGLGVEWKAWLLKLERHL